MRGVPNHGQPLVDVVPGQTGRVYAGWIIDGEQEWRDGIRLAALDPFRGYPTALADPLPSAVRVLDAFHVVKLGLDMLDQLRRWVQQETRGHRGHNGDPLDQVRRRLRRGAEQLTEPHRMQPDAALTTGDPTGEVTLACQVAQDLRVVYHAPTAQEGRRRARRLIQVLPGCPVPQVARLGRTLRSWRVELLAYFDTASTSHTPPEAVNLLVEKLRRIGHGFRTFDSYRLRLLLSCDLTWHNWGALRIRTRRPRFVA